MIDSLRHIYFIGIGGIGMSAVARYFHHRGVRISGYDKTRSELTDELIAEGMSICFQDDVSLLPAETDLVVYTPAIPADHSQLQALRDRGIPVMKRAEVLGLISRDTVCLAVAGTHGKTTTTTMLAHLLRSSGVDCTAFLGGISANYMTNYLEGDTKLVVVEADEYDRSFLHLEPSGAVITSMDADHLDIYGNQDAVVQSYTAFAGKIKEGGKLFVKQGLKLTPAGNQITSSTYGLEQGDRYSSGVHVANGAFCFDYHGNGTELQQLELYVPGLHNVENATAAISLALEFGATPDGIRKGIKEFKGVHRRFEFVLRSETNVVIDDYAHHPAELKAAISAARQLYPGKKITGVFQPHLFSRTRDFAEQFAASLELLDTLVLLEIYPAREKPIEGVNSAMLLAKVNVADKFLCSKEELVNLVQALNPEITMMMGAGDIDRLVAPVAVALTKGGGV